ncbi:SRPBCC family protein [Sphingomonas oryzagri]
MASIRRHMLLAASPDAVWSLVGDPTTIADWAPSIESCSMDGSMRTLVLKRGGLVVEEIITRDDALRRLQYSVRSGLPLKHHLGTVDVIDSGEGSSLVIYSTDVLPDKAAPAVEAAIAASIEALREQFGTSQ